MQRRTTSIGRDGVRHRVKGAMRRPRGASPAAIAYYRRDHGGFMLIKFIAFVAAAVPIFLFVRSVLFRRAPRVSQGWREFKKQLDFAVWIFLILVGCVMAFAIGKLAWTWWAA
jgi:hypothetical protein